VFNILEKYYKIDIQDKFKKEDIMSVTLTKPELEVVQKAAKEMSDSLTRQQAERDLQKDIVESMKEKFELKASDFNRIVKVYHDQKLNEVIEQHENFVDFYESVFNSNE